MPDTKKKTSEPTDELAKCEAPKLPAKETDAVVTILDLESLKVPVTFEEPPVAEIVTFPFAPPSVMEIPVPAVKTYSLLRELVKAITT